MYLLQDWKEERGDVLWPFWAWDEAQQKDILLLVSDLGGQIHIDCDDAPRRISSKDRLK